MTNPEHRGPPAQSAPEEGGASGSPWNLCPHSRAADHRTHPERPAQVCRTRLRAGQKTREGKGRSGIPRAKLLLTSLSEPRFNHLQTGGVVPHPHKDAEGQEFHWFGLFFFFFYQSRHFSYASKTRAPPLPPSDTGCAPGPQQGWGRRQASWGLTSTCRGPSRLLCPHACLGARPH